MHCNFPDRFSLHRLCSLVLNNLTSTRTVARSPPVPYGDSLIWHELTSARSLIFAASRYTVNWLRRARRVKNETKMATPLLGKTAKLI